MTTPRPEDDAAAQQAADENPVGAALFALQDNLRAVAETLEGEVRHLRGNGWTDSQARAIVATSTGWRAPGTEEPEGN